MELFYKFCIYFGVLAIVLTTAFEASKKIHPAFMIIIPAFALIVYGWIKCIHPTDKQKHPDDTHWRANKCQINDLKYKRHYEHEIFQSINQ